MEIERLEILKDSPKSKVYLVYDTSHRRMAVEKRLAGDAGLYHRLQELTHPYLPQIYDVRWEAGETVIVEEYIAGGSIAQVKAGEKQLTRWLLELCTVLSFLHRHGILHRDIKPSNLLIGEDGHIRLIDFDAAREEKPEADRDTQLLGTRGYAPPEQYGFAQTDERADIYALGVTFRELLGKASGRRRWKHILNRCTAMEPKRRYRHVQQLRWAIVAGRIRRRILYPVLAVLLILTSGAMLWSYVTDTDFRDAIGIVCSSNRDLIFRTVNMEELKNSDAELRRFPGGALEIYERLVRICPEGNFISTGYSGDDGYLLFGGFSATYNITTGERNYSAFEGLYYLTAEQTVVRIPPEDCEPYAPAVLALYQLDVFDTPLF